MYCLKNPQLLYPLDYFFPKDGSSDTVWQSGSSNPLAMPSLYTTWQLTFDTKGDEALERGFQALDLTSCDGGESLVRARPSPHMSAASIYALLEAARPPIGATHRLSRSAVPRTGKARSLHGRVPRIE